MMYDKALPTRCQLRVVQDHRAQRACRELAQSLIALSQSCLAVRFLRYEIEKGPRAVQVIVHSRPNNCSREQGTNNGIFALVVKTL